MKENRKEILFGKTIVIKYGGNAMINEELKKTVMEDMVQLSRLGIRVVLVHGGGPEISRMLDRLGKETKFIDGLRYTDEETAEIAAMVLAGKVNKSLVSLIQVQGGNAVGLCGLDGGMLQVEKRKGETDLGFVGEITKADPALITMALDHGYIPVIATIGADEKGRTYNINGDTAAAAVAAALKAERLVVMTDVKGLLLEKDDEDSLIGSISTEEAAGLIETGVISGGMIPKIQSCIEGIRSGIKEVVMIDGRAEHSVLTELLRQETAGTRIY